MAEITQDLVDKLRRKEITAEEAINRFDIYATKLGDIPVNDLKVDILECGFSSLDELMVFKKGRGDLIVIGARPSVGKSAMLFQISTHVAKTKNVLVYSLEMDNASIKARMLAANTGYGLQRIFKGEIKAPLLAAANEDLKKLNFYIDDTSGLDIDTLVARTLDFHAKHPLDLVVVDYLQLIRTSGRPSRNEEVGDVSSKLKTLAKRLRCPVLTAAQLNRKCIDRGMEMLKRGKAPDFRPEMSDLRESGSIEQDADAIIFLSRHEVFAPGYREGEADIVVAKQRNGPTGNLVFKWLGASTRFLDPANREESI